MIVVESNIDDMSGEIAGYVMEEILKAGALDVFYTPIYMKKNRPAVKLTVICHEDDLDILQNIILKETTTIGVRMYKTQRTCMDREFIKVNIPYGSVGVKVSTYNGIKKYIPEYEDCKNIAKVSSIPLKEIYDMVLKSINKN